MAKHENLCKKSRTNLKQIVLPLVFVRGDIFQNILYFTRQDFTKRVERCCRDRLAVLHAVHRVGWQAVFVNQGVFRNAFLMERIIKRSI